MMIGGRAIGRVALGTASWAVHRQPLDAVSAVGVLAAALEEGVTLIDTARAYVDPELRVQSERLVATALRDVDAPDRVNVLRATGPRTTG